MSNDLPETISVECLRVPIKKFKPDEIEEKVKDRALDKSTQDVLRKTMKEGTDTVWDRFERQQPQCKFCTEGISCKRCAMGPCRLMGGDRIRGVCGADADLMVARNLLDTMATGAASHSDHGREVVETLLKAARGKAPGYAVKDEEKLKLLATEYGLPEDDSINQKAEKLALAMLEEFGTIKGETQMPKRAPQACVDLWKAAGILPRGIDREVVEAMHRVHMGVGADYSGFLL